ncbi:hypothetical protein ACQEU3_23630 [Spirillospora sp. CA-253888]
MGARNGPDPREHRQRFASFLKDLRDEAMRVRARKGHRLTSRQICAEAEGADGKRFSAWVNGADTPSPDQDGVVRRLIDVMEEYAGRSARTPQEWDVLLRLAQEEGRFNQGSRRGTTYRPTGPGPFRYLHTAKGKPPELQGRQADLDRLCELVGNGSNYLSLVAPPWAGKTAFLKTFAASYAPESIDLIAYFVRWGTDSDSAQSFLNTMVRALSSHVGRKKPPSDRDTATLLDLYEAAARKSRENGRNLLLLVDGLDEDAVSYPDGESIASLLPPELHPGLVVLVSRRWHPPLPDDVPPHHPLRHAEQMTNFRPSPEAAALRGEVSRSLNQLLVDRDEGGREVVGFLTVARGGLSKSDLTELIGGELTRYDLDKRLNSAAGRGLCLEESEPGTFVLAHRDLHDAASRALTTQACSELRRRLHAWADGYRNGGWPASTPWYLLHGYVRLLWQDGTAERHAAFGLDHRRLLRLASRGRVDLALFSLDRVTRAMPTPAVLASAAASRSLLEAKRRPVPREVLRALCAVGDVERARALALAPGDPASKEVRLLEAVQALSDMETPEAAKQARSLATEAALWAGKAEHQSFLMSPAAEWDTVAIVPRTAVVLAGLGQSDEAIGLLRTVDVCQPENVEPAARAAGLLRAADLVFSRQVLDELLLEAESQAESEEGDPVLAVGIWASVAAHDHERAERILVKMQEFSARFAEVSPGPAAVKCCAVTASALAKAVPKVMPEEAWSRARELAETALRGIRAAPHSASPDEISESLALLVQAHLDLGERDAAVRTMLDEFPMDVTARAALLLDEPAGEPTDTTDAERTAAAEESDLLGQAKSLSDLGDGPRLRGRVDQFTKAVAELEAHVPWRPFLAEALPYLDGDVGPALAFLTDEGTDSVLRVRVLTSAAMAFAQAWRHDEAVRCATEAAATAERLDPRRPEVRALVAQAFAHVGEDESAARWARPDDGKRPSMKAGISYRRASLAVRVGRAPASFVREIVPNGSPLGSLASVGRSGGINRPGAVGGDFGDALRRSLSSIGPGLIDALSSVAAGASAEAHVASLQREARARLSSEPLIATGLALLQAVLGDSAGACRTADEVPDAAARGIAQVTIAGFLAGLPAYLDVTGGEDYWTLSVLRVFAHHLRPAGAGEADLVRDLAVRALGTDSWYWALPLLGRTDPEVVHTVVKVLDHHRHMGADTEPQPSESWM